MSKIMKAELFVWIFVIVNTFSFCMYGLDKFFSIRVRQRISEKTLLLCSFFFGATGSLLAMYIFHHKTIKPLFKLVYVFFMIQWIVIWKVFFSHLPGI